MRNLIAVGILLLAGVLVCRSQSQPQGGVRGVTFQKSVQIFDVECMSGSLHCSMDNDGTLWLDSAMYESESGRTFRKIECGAGLSCRVEGDKLIITGGGGK
jgi:hypothetical protein